MKTPALFERKAAERERGSANWFSGFGRLASLIALGTNPTSILNLRFLVETDFANQTHPRHRHRLSERDLDKPQQPGIDHDWRCSVAAAEWNARCGIGLALGGGRRRWSARHVAAAQSQQCQDGSTGHAAPVHASPDLIRDGAAHLLRCMMSRRFRRGLRLRRNQLAVNPPLGHP